MRLIGRIFVLIEFVAISRLILLLPFNPLRTKLESWKMRVPCVQQRSQHFYHKDWKMLTQSSIPVFINNEKLSFCALRRDRATIDFDNLWDFSLKKLWLWSLFVHSSQKVDKSFIFTTLMGFNRSRTARVWISVSQDQPTWRTKRINFSVLMVCGLGRELTTAKSGEKSKWNLLFIGIENLMNFWLLVIGLNIE